MNQDFCQVLLIQDEEVRKSMCLHVGCSPVSSTSCKQTDRSKRKKSSYEYFCKKKKKKIKSDLKYLHKIKAEEILF